MTCRASEKTQTAGSNLIGKDFSPTMKDFVNTGFDFSPIEDYLDHKVDVLLKRKILLVLSI